MLRSTLCPPFLVICLAGCFSDPPGSESGTGSSGGAATSAGDGTTATTDPTAASSMGSETTAAPTSSSSSSSSSDDSNFDTSTAADESSSTGGRLGPCDCPSSGSGFCEDFEDVNDFDGDKTDLWVVPSMGQPPQQVAGMCGQAFRGEIDATEQFAVLSRRLLNVLSNDDTDVIRLTGLLRIEAGCAAMTPHRLISARTDMGLEGVLYTAELELREGAIFLVQRPTGQNALFTDLGSAPMNDWVPFEISLLGLQSGSPLLVRASIGGVTEEVARPIIPTEQLSFSTIPGPFAYVNPALAGCTVDYDNIAVELLR